MLQKSYTEVVTAGLIVEVVDKRAFLAVGEEDPDHTETS